MKFQILTLTLSVLPFNVEGWVAVLPPASPGPRTKWRTRHFRLGESDQHETMIEQDLGGETINSSDPHENVEYAIPDGDLWDKEDNSASVKEVEREHEATGATAVFADENLEVSPSSPYDSLTKPRSYPLFLVEKAFEVVESFYPNRQIQNPFLSSSDATKEKVVVLGSGWGSISFLQYIDPSLHTVTVLSPRDHFCFTPLLAGASVGTVDLRSVCEPISQVNRDAAYLQAMAKHVDPTTKTITFENVKDNSVESIGYDRLIVTVGAQSNTFGIDGVAENCLFLRHVEDAKHLKRAITNAFRLASQPGLTDDEKQKHLTFCIIGGGPTGVELAAELKDFIQQDGRREYTDLIRHARVKIIQASSTVLAQFDPELQKEAILRMNQQAPNDRHDSLSEPLTELILETSVTKINKDTIELDGGDIAIPYGVAVWAAGNGPLPITMNLIDSLGTAQAGQQRKARGRLAVDPWMRVIGSRDGSIFAVGDCSYMAKEPLPATAQVASQQGEYLAKLMNRKFDLSPSASQDGDWLEPPRRDPIRTETGLSDSIANIAMNNSEIAKPFQFLNLGIMAYTGNGSALAQVTPTPEGEPIKGTGALANFLWRGLYLTKQISWRNRLLVLNNWLKSDLFGRDV